MDSARIFERNLTYADDKVAFSDYLVRLRRAIREDTEQKIRENNKTEKTGPLHCCSGSVL